MSQSRMSCSMTVTVMLNILTMPTLRCCSLSTVGPRVSSEWNQREREREIPIRQHPVCDDSGPSESEPESKWIFSGIMQPGLISTQSNHKWQMKYRWATLPLNWQHGVRTWAKVVAEENYSWTIDNHRNHHLRCRRIFLFASALLMWVMQRVMWGGGALTRCHLLRLSHSAIIPHTHRCHPRHWSCSPGDTRGRLWPMMTLRGH